MSKRLQFDDISARTLDVLLRHMYASAAGRVVKLEEDQLTEDLISAMDRLDIFTLKHSSIVFYQTNDKFIA